MNKIKIGALALFTALLTLSVSGSFTTPQAASTFKLDTRSSYVLFQVNAKIEKVNGYFKKFRVKDFKYTPGKVDSLSGKVEVDVSSVRTRKRKRDTHLRQSDFFHVKKYPTATVVVKSVREEEDDFGDKEYRAKIALTIRGITREYDIPVRIKETSSKLYVRGAFRVDRNKFKVSGNIISNAILDDKVVLRFYIIMKK